jgi:hypothetical protein
LTIVGIKVDLRIILRAVNVRDQVNGGIAVKRT